MLGLCARDGWDGTCHIDEAQALEHLQTASDRGDSEAAFQLGLHHDASNGTKAREQFEHCAALDSLAAWPCSLAWYWSWVKEAARWVTGGEHVESGVEDAGGEL